jgi:hypothetical protein
MDAVATPGRTCPLRHQYGPEVFRQVTTAALRDLAVLYEVRDWFGRADVVHRGLHIDALAIEVEPAAARQTFLAQWPAGTDAHASYFDRIKRGPDYAPHQVLRQEM